jgi:hypothetical protein
MTDPGTIENTVLFGKNGYLFLAGGAHRVFDIVTGKAAISAESFEIFGKNITERAAWAAQNGAQFAHLIMPDKQSIIPEEWPLASPLKIGAAYIERNPEVQSQIIYPVSALAERSAKALSHLDTHLTDYGSILVTKLLVESLSGEPQSAFADELIRQITRVVRSSGDLGSKLMPQMFGSEEKFGAQQPGFYFHNDFSGGNNGAVDLRFNPSAPYQKRVAFFGDSFGRDIVRFLQFWYREVLFFRTGYFHEEIASLCKPDIVLTENVERYLDDCRPDGERPHFLLYPYLQPKSYAPSPEFAEALSAVLSYPRKPYSDFVDKLAMTDRVAPLTPNQPPPSQIKNFDGVRLVDYPPSAGLLSFLEEPKIVQQRPPAFVANLSGRAFPPWFRAEQDIHGSYLVRRENVLLFGPNHLVSGQGLWSCESRSFKRQFIDMLHFPSYNAIFPGPKPLIEFNEENFVLSTNNLSPGAVTRIDEPIFLATPLEPDNWGRWIATVAPKAMQYKAYGAGRRFVCRVAKPWQRAFLNAFGIRNEMILDHDPGRTYICSDVMTVEYSVTNMTVSAQEREGFLKIAAKHKQSERENSKIFVSRLSHSKRHPGYRVLQNEADLSAELSALGFTLVEPETLPLEEQIAFFASASSVVCIGGAALYNTVFCASGTKVITIEASDAFISPHTQLLSSMDLNYGIVFGQEDPADPSPAHKRWTLDIEQAVQIMARFIKD